MMEWNLRVLEWIQNTRTPFLDNFFATVTHLGDELVLVPVFCVMLWCVHKKFALHVSFAFFSGTFLGQLLKIIFCIPRPWLLSSTLHPVESAVEGASGFSFPSGHTASATGIYGGVAMNLRKWWIVLPLGLLTFLVAYSRLYLGVHTPLDVGISLVLGVLLLFAAQVVMRFAEKKNGDVAVLIGGLILCAGALVLIFCRQKSLPEDMENFLDAYKAVGGGMGYFTAWFLERRYVRFNTAAPLWFQGAKLLCGTGLLLLIQQGLKSPLHTLFGEAAGDFIRYFLLILFALALYPFLFKTIGDKIKGKDTPKTTKATPESAKKNIL